MGPRGPKPSSLGRSAFTVLSDYLAPPPDRQDDSAFMRHWSGVTRTFPAEHFASCDQGMLETYCKLAVRFEQMERQIDEVGYLVESSGGPKANPLIAACTAVARQMTTMARSLRITPSSRMAAGGVSVEDSHMEPDGDRTNQGNGGGLRLAN